MTDARRRPHRTKAAAFRIGTLNRLLLAHLFSTHGIWMLRVGIGWVAWTTTQSAFWVGAISSMTLLPSLFLTPIFGVLADRIRLRVAMPVVTSVKAGVGAVLAFLSLTGSMSLEALVAMATVFGLAAAVYHSFRVTIPARIDVDTPLPNIIGMSSIIFNISGIIGPALAGAALATAGEALVFAMVSCFYGTYLALFRTLEFKPRPGPPVSTGFIPEFTSGLRVALTLPELLAGAASVFVAGLIGRALIAQLPTVSGKLLGGDADTYASLVTASAAGAIVAGLVMARLQCAAGGIRRNLYLAAIFAMFLSGACSGLANYVSFLVAIACLGFALTVVGACSQSLLQLAVPDGFRGRVMSFWSMASHGGSAFGVLLLGAAGDAIGMRPALLVSGIVGCLMIGAVFLADQFRARRSALADAKE